MADDVTVDNGEGTDYDVATDDDGSGNHVQIVKLAQSADGSRTPITADSGGMLVNLGTNNDVTVTGTVDLGSTDNGVLDAIAADGDAIQTLISTLDAVVDQILTATQAIETAVEGTLTVGSHAVTNAGTFAVQDSTVAGHLDTVETLLGTIDADTSTLAAAVSTEMQVDVVGALPAGTNAIGKLAANSGVDIGDVDVTSISAGDNVIGRVKISDGTDVADVLDLTNTNPLTVAIVDGDGSQITSFGGSGGTASADDDDFTAGTTQGTPVMGAYDDDATAVTDNDMGIVRITSDRKMHVTDTAAGTLLTTIAGDTTAIQAAVEGTLTVDNAGTFAVQDATVAGHVDGIEALLGTIDADTSDIHTNSDTMVTHLATIAGDTTAIEAAVEGTLTVQGTIPPTADEVNAPTPFFSADLDESEEDVGGGNPVAVYGYMIANADATNWAYVKFYNDTAANIEVGTDTPLYTVSVPPGSAANLSLAPAAWVFPTALCVAATTGPAANDTGAPGAGDVQCQLWFTFST